MPNRDAVQGVLARVREEGRASLTALEAKQVCDAYGIPVPEEGMATTAALAGDIADEIGYPVVMKIVSPDILHKTDAGGVITGIEGRDAAVAAYDRIVAAARDYDADADILGVQVQQQMQAAQEVIVGGVTDPSFGKLVAFGLGGILVEVLKDVTFRLAPATEDDAGAMLDEIAGAEVLRGVRGGPGVDRDALAGLIANVSQLISDFPEISEMDLNPVFATPDGVCAVDTRILLDFDPAPPRYRPSHDEILGAMTRIMQPDGVAVIGASAGEGKIGNSVMKNLIDGGYQGEILSDPSARDGGARVQVLHQRHRGSGQHRHCHLLHPGGAGGERARRVWREEHPRCSADPVRLRRGGRARAASRDCAGGGGRTTCA